MPTSDAALRPGALPQTADKLSAALLSVHAALDIEALPQVICETVACALQLPRVSLELVGDPRTYVYPPSVENESAVSFKPTEYSLSNFGAPGAVLSLSTVALELTTEQRTLLEPLLPHLGQAISNARMFNQHHRRADELAAVLETVRVLSVEKDLSYFIDRFAAHVVRALNASAATIYLCDESEDGLELAGVNGIAHSPLPRRIPYDDAWLGHAATRRQTFAFDERLINQSGFAAALAESLHAGLQIPMVCADELIGVFGLYAFRDKPRAFTPADVRLLELLANQAASHVYNRKMFELVRASRERLQTLSYRLMQAHEEERRAIARELHDEIGQTLTGFQLNLQALAHSLPPRVDPAPLRDAMTGIETALEQLRDLSRNLRPSVLDDFGLIPAIEWYAARVRRRSHLNIELLLDSIEPRLPVEIETTCFRMLQEAITNVLRHARATRVRVTLKYDNAGLDLTIEDDGIGFDVAAALEQSSHGASLGLLGMQERILLSGGRVSITSTPGVGSRIWCVFPVERQVKVERRRHRRGA